MRAWLSCRRPCHAWHSQSHTPRRQPPVVCAKGGRTASRRQRPAEAARERLPKKPKSKTLQMAEFKADEVLLFDPVPAGRSVCWCTACKAGAEGERGEGRVLNPQPPTRPRTRVARRNAALQVVYAYPNEYTVGITSLGYQLVRLSLAGGWGRRSWHGWQGAPAHSHGGTRAEAQAGCGGSDRLFFCG